MSVLFSAHILIFSPHPDKIWDLYRLFSWKVSSDFKDIGPVSIHCNFGRSVLADWSEIPNVMWIPLFLLTKRKNIQNWMPKVSLTFST